MYRSGLPHGCIAAGVTGEPTMSRFLAVITMSALMCSAPHVCAQAALPGEARPAERRLACFAGATQRQPTILISEDHAHQAASVPGRRPSGRSGGCRVKACRYLDPKPSQGHEAVEHARRAC